MFSLGLAGCDSPKKQAESAAPFAGRTVVVRGESELGLNAAWGVAAQDWEAATGAKVRFEEWPADGKSAAKSPSPREVVVTTLARLPERTAELGEGGWSIIPESQRGETQLHWMDVLPGLRETTCVRRREPTLVPISLPVMVLGYREDLLRKAGLEAPATWEEYASLAKKVGDWAPGLVVAEPWREDVRASWFLARSLAYARHPGQLAVFFDLDTLAPRISAPPFAQALTEAREVYRAIPMADRDMSPADCRRALIEGRAALAICAVNGEWNNQSTKSPGEAAPVEAVAGLSVGFAPLPGSRRTYDPGRKAWVTGDIDAVNRPTLVDWGGTGFGGAIAGVVAGGDVVANDAAFHFLASVVVATGGKTLPKSFRGTVRQSQLDSPEDFASSDWPSYSVPQVVAAGAASLGRDNIVCELPVAGREMFRAALTRALEKALTSDADSAGLLEEAAREWEKIVAEIGTAKVRSTYRESLGFRPELATTDSLPKAD